MLGIPQTFGDVSRGGGGALHLSIGGGATFIWPRAAYAVCVNTMRVAEAQPLVGPVPDCVQWIASDGDIHDFPGRPSGLAAGVVWKFAPLGLFPDRHEMTLENDCILWDVPAGLRRLLAGEEAWSAPGR